MVLYAHLALLHMRWATYAERVLRPLLQASTMRCREGEIATSGRLAQIRVVAAMMRRRYACSWPWNGREHLW